MKKFRKWSKPRVPAKCRDCGKAEAVERAEFSRASRARCSSCGGQLDKVSRDTMERANDKIVYPDKHSEFEVQCHIYNTLRDMGVDARGEVMTQAGTARLDIVIYEAKRPVMILEIKRSRPKRNRFQSRRQNKIARESQCRRYERFGVRVVLVEGMTGAEKFLESFMKDYEKPPQESVQDFCPLGETDSDALPRPVPGLPLQETQCTGSKDS